MADYDEKKCKCPACNCFAGLVHVPTEGKFLVVDGKVMALEDFNRPVVVEGYKANCSECNAAFGHKSHCSKV